MDLRILKESLKDMNEQISKVLTSLEKELEEVNTDLKWEQDDKKLEYYKGVQAGLESAISQIEDITWI